MTKRFYFETGDNFKNIAVVGLPGSRTINISVEDEWCGDTETGFGANVDMDLDRKDADELIKTLQEWLNTEEN